jgi:hypothetical protein
MGLLWVAAAALFQQIDTGYPRGEDASANSSPLIAKVHGLTRGSEETASAARCMQGLRVHTLKLSMARMPTLITACDGSGAPGLLMQA